MHLTAWSPETVVDCSEHCGVELCPAPSQPLGGSCLLPAAWSQRGVVLPGGVTNGSPGLLGGASARGTWLLSLFPWCNLPSSALHTAFPPSHPLAPSPLGAGGRLIECIGAQGGSFFLPSQGCAAVKGGHRAGGVGSLAPRFISRAQRPPREPPELSDPPAHGSGSSRADVRKAVEARCCLVFC